MPSRKQEGAPAGGAFLFRGYVGTYPVLAILVKSSLREISSFGCIGSFFKTLTAIYGSKRLG